MLKIEVKSTEITTQSGNKNGRDWSIRAQEAYAYIKNRNGSDAPFPEKIRINLDNGNSSRAMQAPYAIGVYYLSDSAIYVGDFSSLRLGNPVLMTEAEVRLNQQMAKPAAVAA